MKKTKILYGICGLGNGHTYRQLPIVEHLSSVAEITILAHDNSYNFYATHFKDHPSVEIIRVAVPFYVGDKNGLDFQASAASPLNQKNIFRENCLALDRVNRELGQPDLVITDYESTSAQYAYSRNAPLVTIDQQTKYLYGDFPEELSGFTFKDEIARLRMFFPRAEARLVCSFFNFSIIEKLKNEATNEIVIFPPTIKDAIAKIKRKPLPDTFLVYISSAREYPQTPESIITTLSAQKNAKFNIFVNKIESDYCKEISQPNIKIHEFDDEIFIKAMSEARGIISTAGHSLLSEAMYLGIPVYAIPVSPYEQHMNARIIDTSGFGISHPVLNSDRLDYFIKNISKFENNISKDKTILIRGNGQEKIINFLRIKFPRLKL